MASLLTWLDDRTGYKAFVHDALYEHVPGGARWRYVWGSTLLFAFGVQMITGLLLWMHYSPSAQTAWESVYYIQHEMTGGWLLRGMHHYTAQVMVILLALHMLQVIVDGAYRAPREFNFWIGIVLLNIVLGLSLTGYLLPWDQKGYAATKVATSIMNVVPLGVGPVMQRLVLGGADYGHHTLTRFFAVHAGLLPFLMIVFTGVHVYLFRRHGLRYKEPRRGADSYFWPDQVLKDAVACLGVLAVVLLLCIKFGLAPGGLEHANRLGAELSAPADPSEAYGAARPEWYFLFLFQFLKLPAFAGPGEVYGAVVIPGVIMLLLVLMPLTGRWKVGHWFNVLLTVFLATGMVLLTTMALVEDAGRPHLNIPLLGRLGLGFSVIWVGLLALLVLALIPMIGRERQFRANMWVLGALVVGVLVAVAVVVAGGGTATPEHWGEKAHRWLLFGMLCGLVLLITMVLLKSPVRTSGQLAADKEVTAAADAEVADAAAANAGASADASPPAQEAQGSWMLRWEVHHRFRLALLFVVLGGTVLLSAISVVGGAETEEKRAAYRAAVGGARRDAERVIELASGPTGIPPQGAVWLLRNDPLTQGPRLFARNCASCHRYEGHDGLGNPVKDPQSAAELKGFATRQWISGLLDPHRIAGPEYFGNTALKDGEMIEFVKEDLQTWSEEKKQGLPKIVAALSAQANLPAHVQPPADPRAVEQGRALLSSVRGCAKCHSTPGGKEQEGAPSLVGYGSRRWMVDFIKNPAHPRFYGQDNDRMPAYGEQKILDDRQIGLIVDWLRGEAEVRTAEAAVEAPASRPASGAPAATSPAPSAEPTTPARPETLPATTAPASTAPAATAPATTAPAESTPATTAPATTAPATTAPSTKPSATEPPPAEPKKPKVPESEFD